MKYFGKILDIIGLTFAVILSIVGAHIIATGGNPTLILIGIVICAIISGIGLSIHRK